MSATELISEGARQEEDKLAPQLHAGVNEGTTTDLTGTADDSGKTGMTPKTTCTTPVGASELMEANLLVDTEIIPVENNVETASPSLPVKSDEVASRNDGGVSPSRNKKRKKKGSSYRRRQRKSAEKQEASFTRLAAVLGQIKEACAKEEVGVKVGPLIEVATGIVETLSTKAAIMVTSNMQQKTNSDTSEIASTPQNVGQNNCSSPSCAKIKYSPGPLDGFNNNSSREWNCNEFVVRAGQRIPPHVYLGGGNMRGLRMRDPAGRQQAPPPQSASHGGNAPPLARPPQAIAMTEREKEQARKERALSDLRSRLRAASTVSALQTIIKELETTPQADYELTVARAKLLRLAAA